MYSSSYDRLVKKWIRLRGVGIYKVCVFLCDEMGDVLAIDFAKPAFGSGVAVDLPLDAAGYTGGSRTTPATDGGSI